MPRTMKLRLDISIWGSKDISIHLHLILLSTLLLCISSERLLTLTACSCVCILGLINYTSKLDNILISSWGHQKPIPGNFEQILSAEAVHNLGSKQPTNRKHIYVWLNLDILQRFSWPRSQHQSQYKDSSLVLILSFCLEWTSFDAAAWCLLAKLGLTQS